MNILDSQRIISSHLVYHMVFPLAPTSGQKFYLTLDVKVLVKDFFCGYGIYHIIMIV